MIVKMLCTFEFNPETNTYTPVGEPELVKTQSKPKSKIDNSPEPKLILDDNKYTLNNAAIELMNINAGDKVDIKYQIVDKINYPIIGASSIWKSNSGNKLTKSGTVSYRGKANTVLAEFGDTFELAPWKDHEGLFILMGNEPVQEVVEDDNIELPENKDIEEDIREDNIEDKVSETLDELSLEDLEDSETLEDDNVELSGFKFKF